MHRFRIISLTVFLFAGAIAAQAQQYLVQEGLRSFQQGEFDRSIDLLEQALATDSLQLNAYVLLGASYLRKETPELAQLKAEQGLKHFPNTGSLIWLQAEALFQQRLLEEALPLYSDLKKNTAPNEILQPLQVGRSHIRKRLIETNKILASQAFKRNDLDKADTYLSNIQELNPGDIQVKKNRVFLYLQQEKWEQALELANKELKNSSEDRDLLRMKASALYNLENYEGLRNEYRTLYEQDPTDIETALTYAEILVGTQKSTDAEKIYEKLLEEYPKERRIYDALIEVNERRLNIPGKRAVLRRMEKQFPDDKSITRAIAGTFEQQDQVSDARAVYDSLMTVGGKTVELQKKVAQTHVEQDSLNQAYMIYRELYRENSEDKDLILNYGKILEQTDREANAQKIYRQYLSQDQDKDVLYRLGIVQIQLDQPTEAIASFRQALEYGSQEPDLYLQLSKLLVEGEKKERREARVKSEQALRLSLEAIRENQQQVEQQLSKNSLGAYTQNEDQFEELEWLNSLAEEAFTYFAEVNSKERISLVLSDLEQSYPGSGRLLYLIGSYYRDEQQNEKAQSYFELSIHFSTNLLEAHLALAKLLEENGQYESSITSFERALALDPKKTEPYDALIRLYRKLGTLDQLCDRWLARYRADLDNEMLKDFLIEALHKADRFDEAREIIDQ